MINGSDVIAAIATPPGRGAIGIVRLSGKGSAAVLSKVFSPVTQPAQWVSHRMEYGKIVHNGVVIDEVMAAVMLAPRSYTKEDSAEIYAHGGMAGLRAILNAVIANGARPAGPGEFTQRAFLNGRINLTQAEAVADVINASTDAARDAGLKLLGGGLSRRVVTLRGAILKWLANIELSIDYPEHEAEAMNAALILSESAGLISEIEKLLRTYAAGRVITEGISAAIIGRPNVGKSSLLNAVLHEDRAIVTEIPGTTRDILSETIQIHGIALRLSDTAGIRNTADAIEREGVEKALRQAANAALVIFVADASQPPADEDLEILDGIKHKQFIIVLNKSDMPRALGWEQVNGIPVSAKEQTGLEALYAAIREACMAGLDNTADEAVIITHERHALLLEKTIASLKKAEDALRSQVPEDLVSVDLREAYRLLGEIIGEEVGDDVVERIFSEFCVGK